MIHISIYRDNNSHYKGFVCDGHAEFDDPGHDIVCSAVSVLTMNTVNSIDILTPLEFTCDMDEETGFMKFMIKDDTVHEADILMESLVIGLSSIEESYSDYIQLEIEEV